MRSKNKILIFTQYSNKIGLGHFIRSQRLYFRLKKNFFCKFYYNKDLNFIKSTLKKIKNIKIVIFDYKIYQKNLLNFNRNIFYIFFDQKRIINKNLLSLNPLYLTGKNNFNGPKWFPYPENFNKKRRKKIFKKKFNIFISQGGTDSMKNINNIINTIDFKNSKINKVFVKIPKANYLKFNNKKLIKIQNLKNLFKILNNTDIAISACGNFSYEISFFQIPSIYISGIKDEIKRGKILSRKGFGKFFKIRNINKIKTELDLLMKNKTYYNKLVNKKSFFNHNGLLNIEKKIVNILKENEI